MTRHAGTNPFDADTDDDGDDDGLEGAAEVVGGRGGAVYFVMVGPDRSVREIDAAEAGEWRSRGGAYRVRR